MQLQPQSASRLLAFCSKLPAFPGDKRTAEDNLRFALSCFAARRQEVEGEMQAAAGNTQGLAMLRCELEALDSAKNVLGELWLRRFGSAHSPN
jgi:hypothetical protein